MANGSPAVETVEIDGVVLNADDVLRTATELRKRQAEENAKSRVPQHLRCPTCWNGYGGTGIRKWWNQKSGTLIRMCYRCRECGTEWVARVEISVVDSVEHRSTRVSEVRDTR